MRVQVVDPSAYTRPYDHALCSALARAGADVELVTSAFAYADAPSPDGYAVRELFYRHARGPAGSQARTTTKLIEHVPNMLALRRLAAACDVVHFQWLAVQPIDHYLLPRRPTVLTAHDLLPREPRPLQSRAQRRLYGGVDAIVAHSEFGRRLLIDRLGVEAGRVRVIHHGAFDYLTRVPVAALPPELAVADEVPVVLFFGLLRPYKGIEVLLEAWRAVVAEHDRAELWIVGRPRMSIGGMLGAAPPSVKWVTRFVSDAELAACFRRANVMALPYLHTERFDFSGVLATALAFGKATVLSEVGGFREVSDAGGALLVPPGDPAALADRLSALLSDEGLRERLETGARAAAAGPYSWDRVAEQTLELYRELAG